MRISDWSSDVCSSDLFVEACAGSRRTALHRRDDARRISQICGEGPGLAAAVPAGLRGRADGGGHYLHPAGPERSEEHTSELQSLMRISYAVFCLKKKKKKANNRTHHMHMKILSRTQIAYKNQ